MVAALDALYWKPIQTGSIEGTDRETVRRLAAVPEERLLPEAYIFEPPVSPHLAAREAGVRIPLDTLAWPAIEPRDTDRAWIVEGAGGVLVPINERETMIDLMCGVALPVLIAARNCSATRMARSFSPRITGTIGDVPAEISIPCRRNSARRNCESAISRSRSASARVANSNPARTCAAK